jgi:hypothetical protein
MKKALLAIQLSMNLYAFSQFHPASSPHALRAGDVISKRHSLQQMVKKAYGK